MNKKTKDFIKNRATERKLESKSRTKKLPTGVSRIHSSGKYTARIYRDGIRYYLGCFESAEAAHKFRERAIKENDFRDVYDKGVDDI